jgi:hypothetical protein
VSPGIGGSWQPFKIQDTIATPDYHSFIQMQSDGVMRIVFYLKIDAGLYLGSDAKQMKRFKNRHLAHNAQGKKI